MPRYYKLEKQQNEFFQILVKMADEMAKTREEGPDDRADFRRRTMLCAGGVFGSW